MTAKPEPILFLSDARGVYIPRDFATGIKRDHVTGVDAEAWAILEEGPDHEWYWETWTEVCDRAVITDDNGTKFHVYQDGDCWLVPDGMEWSDHRGFVWPSDDSDEESDQ